MGRIAGQWELEPRMDPFVRSITLYANIGRQMDPNSKNAALELVTDAAELAGRSTSKVTVRRIRQPEE